jgi:hypothetical protein
MRLLALLQQLKCLAGTWREGGECERMQYAGLESVDHGGVSRFGKGTQGTSFPTAV